MWNFMGKTWNWAKDNNMGRALDWIKGIELIKPIGDAFNTTMDGFGIPAKTQRWIKIGYSAATKGVIPASRTYYELAYDTNQATEKIEKDVYKKDSRGRKFFAYTDHEPSRFKKVGWVNLAQASISVLSMGFEIYALGYYYQTENIENPTNDQQKMLDEMLKSYEFWMAISTLLNAASLGLLKLKEKLIEHENNQPEMTYRQSRRTS